MKPSPKEVNGVWLALEKGTNIERFRANSYAELLKLTNKSSGYMYVKVPLPVQMNPHVCCESCDDGYYDNSDGEWNPKCLDEKCKCHLKQSTMLEEAIASAELSEEGAESRSLKQPCTCASFHTVRGVHKEDCQEKIAENAIERAELEADLFAENLLMPRHMIQNYIKKYPMLRENYASLGRIFGVSAVRMLRRMKYLDLV